MAKQLDPGESLLARWLDDRDYPWDFEPDDWGVESCPDFRIHHPATIVAAEVKSIETWGLLGDPEDPTKLMPVATEAASARSRPMQQALKPLRQKITDAAGQLKPLRDKGIPLLVVLANPRNVTVPFTAEALVEAMYGDPEYEFRIEDETAGQLSVGRNGKLTNDHSYLSAIALVRRSAGPSLAATWFEENRGRFESPQAMAEEARRLEAAGAFGSDDWVSMDFVETASDEATRLPPDFVTGSHDTLWLRTETGVTRIR